MYGFPKRLNTRADVDLLMAYLGTAWGTPENVERGLDILRSLKRDQVYVFDRTLGEAEDPDGAAPEYLVVTDEDSGERRQLKQQTDPNATIYRLGLTHAEVDQMINTIEGT